MMTSRFLSRFVLSAAVALAAALLVPADTLAVQGAPNQGAWLGVFIQDANLKLSTHHTAPSRGEGVLITRVLRGAPAEGAGLQRGDVLLAIDETRLQSAEQLRQEISRTRPGTEVRLLVLRGGAHLELNVLLDPKPESLAGGLRRR